MHLKNKKRVFKQNVTDYEMSSVQCNSNNNI